MSLTMTVLAAASPSPTPAKGGEGVKSGPIGLAAILVLCVAVYFLFKSMSRHLKKVRDEFPADAEGNPKQPPPEAPTPPAQPPADAPPQDAQSP
jgi:hypothetical protein